MTLTGVNDIGKQFTELRWNTRPLDGVLDGVLDGLLIKTPKSDRKHGDDNK